ncbi:MAG TPA: hypothetical protein VGA48_01765 [Thermoplasmata archaeon]
MVSGIARVIIGIMLFVISLYWFLAALNIAMHQSSFANAVGWAVPLVPLGISIYLMRSASIRGPLRVVLPFSVCGLIVVNGGVFVWVSYRAGFFAILLIVIGTPLIAAPCLAYLATQSKTRRFRDG